jgi:hypothetical protein
MNCTFGQYAEQSRYRLCELLLEGSPMTTAKSDRNAKECASDWRNSVALHIVSNIWGELQVFFTIFTNFKQISF